METWIKWVIGIVIVIGIALLCILLPLSFASLEPNECGLDYDKTNYQIDTTKLYEEGRYYLGVNHEFKIFPKEMKEIRLDSSNVLKSRTRDGLELNMTLSFQYQLKISLDNIVNLYNTWGDKGYHEAFARISRTVIRDAIGEFEAIDMFKNRTNVEDRIRAKLTEMLSGVQSTLQNFQLLDIKLPGNFSDIIQNIEKAKQDLTSAQFVLQQAEKYANGTIDEAMQKKDIYIQQANSYQKQLQEASTAIRVVDEANVKNDLNAFNYIKSQLGYSTDTAILTHFFYFVLNVTNIGMVGLKPQDASILTLT